MIITIAAMTKDRVIGNGIKIPWHIAEDFKLFKELTTGHAVLMGSTTYNSMGKALPNRKNFVLSFNKIELSDAEVYSSFEEGLNAAKLWAEENNKYVFIIGGASIYKLGLGVSDKLYLSHVKKDYEGNVFFPEINWNEWVEEKDKTKDFEEFTFKSYKRV
ncbi:MAG: dihydrofolate reductase [Candidatus Woesearchaeota archaeon]